MKILLVNAPRTSSGKPSESPYLTPLGIQYLAGYVKEKEPSLPLGIIDGIVEGYSRTLRQIQKYRPDLIAMSFDTSQANGAFQLMTEVRDMFPRVPIIVGGPHPTALPMDAILNSDADISVPGEGEKTFIELIDLYRKSGYFDARELQSIRGIYFRNGARIEKTPLRPMIPSVDSIPAPLRYISGNGDYSDSLKRKQAAVISFRAYPFPEQLGYETPDTGEFPAVRFRTASGILQEIMDLQAHTGVNEIIFYSTPFTLDESQAREICEEILARNLKFIWRAVLIHAEIPDDLLRIMKKAGCFRITLSLEQECAGLISEKSLAETFNSISFLCAQLKKYNFLVHGIFSLFNIWLDDDDLRFDDADTCLNIIDAVGQLHNRQLLDSFRFLQGIPFPVSEQYNLAVKHQFIKETCSGSAWECWGNNEHVLAIPGISRNDIDTIYKTITKLEKRSGTRLLPSIVSRIIKPLKKEDKI